MKSPYVTLANSLLQQNNGPQAPEAAKLPAAQPMPNAGRVGAERNNNKNTAGAKVKEEQNVPKKAKEVNWAPDGYHYVQAVGYLTSVRLKESLLMIYFLSSTSVRTQRESKKWQLGLLWTTGRRVTRLFRWSEGWLMRTYLQTLVLKVF